MTARAATDEEVAAVVVLAALAGRAEPPPSAEAASLWRDPTAVLRAPFLAGPGAWRASGLPR